MSETKYIAKPRLKELLSSPKYKDLYPTQSHFAVATGLSDVTISRFDKQGRYEIETLITISKELGVSVSDLFEVEENESFVDHSKVSAVKQETSIFHILSKFEDLDLKSLEEGQMVALRLACGTYMRFKYKVDSMNQLVIQCSEFDYQKLMHYTGLRKAEESRLLFMQYSDYVIVSYSVDNHHVSNFLKVFQK